MPGTRRDEILNTAVPLRCALLTPPGRGAIASVGVRGVGAIGLVSRLFTPASGKPLTRFFLGSVVFGRFRTAAAAPEELVVGLLEQDELLGQDEVEIHCHGGTAAAEAVLTALVAEGCQRIPWEEWIRQQDLDSTASAALIALAEVRTERTAAILLDQMRGALGAALDGILRDLEGEKLPAAQRRLDELLARADLGRHLTQPWRVVLTGLPNVGKSSLINALLGYQRAIVHEMPGTTRDVLTATTAIEGWPVELADTAGLRQSVDAIEAEGVARALQEVASADLVIEVIEATAAWTGGERLYKGTGDRGQGTGCDPLIVHNKCDLAAPPNDGRPAGLAVSAKTGEGIDRLCQAIAQRLIPQSPTSGAAVPFTERQIARLRDVQARIAKGDVQAALRAIQSLAAGL